MICRACHSQDPLCIPRSVLALQEIVRRRRWFDFFASHKKHLVFVEVRQELRQTIISGENIACQDFEIWKPYLPNLITSTCEIATFRNTNPVAHRPNATSSKSWQQR